MTLICYIGLLTTEPGKRLTMEQIQRHCWFSDGMCTPLATPVCLDHQTHMAVNATFQAFHQATSLGFSLKKDFSKSPLLSKRKEKSLKPTTLPLLLNKADS